MELIQYSRQNRFYYINYFYLPEVQEEFIHNLDIPITISDLAQLSNDQIDKFFSFRQLDIISMSELLGTGNLHLIKHFLNRFKKISPYDLTPAIELNLLDVVDYVLDLVNNDKIEILTSVIEYRTPREYFRWILMSIAIDKNVKIIPLLIDKGFRLSGYEFTSIIEKYKLEDIKPLIDKLIAENLINDNALVVAIKYKNDDLAKYLITKGIQVKWEAISAAVNNKNQEMLKYLIQFEIK